MIDALDSLYLMGLPDEFGRAVAAVAQLDWANTTYAAQINVFETTIRYLGGLLSGLRPQRRGGAAAQGRGARRHVVPRF